MTVEPLECSGISAGCRISPSTYAITNRPGLSALAYRIGTHGAFLQAMLDRLTTHSFRVGTGAGAGGALGGRARPLQGLRARTGDDFAIALLDAWATVADVLTFYQERIANEGYLRTAVERRSVLELARLVGYTLRPGVSASVYLAYTLDKDPDKNKDTTVTIPKQSRAQSVPGPGQLPQSFETEADLLARYSWNNLQPRLTRPSLLAPGISRNGDKLYFDGIITNLKPNDLILLVFGPEKGQQEIVRVAKVTPDPTATKTTVDLQRDRSQAYADLVKAVIEAVTGYRDLGKFKVDTSQMAQKIDSDVLASLLTGLTPNPPPLALVTMLGSSLVPVQEWLALAAARGYSNLVSWLSAIVAGLSQNLIQAQILATELASEASAGIVTGLAPGQAIPVAPVVQPDAVVNDNVPRPSPSVLGLGALLGSLKAPPAAQLSSARELARSPQALFAPGSDLGPQLLVALNPVLGANLYNAWSHADLSMPSPVQSVQSLAVKAAPFGATASLKPIFDTKGAQTGSQEWPLIAPAAVGMRITFNDNTPQAGQVSVNAGDESASVSFKPDHASQTVRLRPGSVKIDLQQDHDERTWTFTYKFSGSLPDRKIIVNYKDNDSVIHVVFDNDPDQPEWEVNAGQSLSHTTAQSRISVSLSAQVHGDEVPLLNTLTISNEALLGRSPMNVIALDAQYDQVTPKSWAVIVRPGQDPKVTRITAVDTVAQAAYNLSGRVTQLTLADNWLTGKERLLSDIRNVTIYAQGTPIDLAWEPVEDDVAGQVVELDGMYSGLQSGRWVIVAGERTDIPGTSGVPGGELAMVGEVIQTLDPQLPGDKVHTVIKLVRPLAYRYKRSTARIWGNVIEATHGETRSEVLGSGAGRLAGQSFALHAAPLTFVPADTPSGVLSTLEVRVNDVRWHEAESLVWLGPKDRGYITRTGDDDKTSVIFGDGVHGARLPTGVENVKGVYRTGIGLPGNVKAEQITQLQNRPLGVNGVINPLPASGGADREGVEQARANIPLGVLALDRLVGVVDYENFTRARAGFGKASAQRLSDGRQEVVHVTIAGTAASAVIDVNSELFRNLRQSLHDYGDKQLPVQVAVCEMALLLISARVKVCPDQSWEFVEPKVRDALLAKFGFDQRSLGQPVYLSEVFEAIQCVPGVEHVDVDVLAHVPESITPLELQKLAEKLQPPPQSQLPMELARYEETAYTAGADDTLTSLAAKNGITVSRLLALNPGLSPTTLQPGRQVLVARGIRPAQLALLSSAVRDTIILQEIKI